MKIIRTLTAFGVGLVLVGSVFATAGPASSRAVSARSYLQAFTSPTVAARRLSVASRAEGIQLFHPCAAVNPYLIRCGGYVGGLKPLSNSGKLRVRMDWRKVNPYMLDRVTYALGGVLEHKLIDTKVAY